MGGRVLVILKRKLLQRSLECLRDILDPDDLCLGHGLFREVAQVVFRDDDLMEAEADGLFDSLFAETDRPDFAGETDLTEGEHVVRDDRFLQGRDQ